MTLNELICQLKKLSNLYGDKEVCVIAPNTSEVTPQIKFKREKEFDFTSDIEKIVLFYE